MGTHVPGDNRDLGTRVQNLYPSQSYNADTEYVQVLIVLWDT